MLAAFYKREKKNAEERILKAKRSPQEGKTNPNTHFLDSCIVFCAKKRKKKANDPKRRNVVDPKST